MLFQVVVQTTKMLKTKAFLFAVVLFLFVLYRIASVLLLLSNFLWSCLFIILRQTLMCNFFSFENNGEFLNSLMLSSGSEALFLLR